MLAGLMLLSFWTAAQLHGVFGSRMAILRFRAAQVTKYRVNAFPLKDPTTGGIVDFSLWSPKRISAYRDSLVRERAVPGAILRIARINLEVPVFDGTDDLTLNRGVGRISGTAQFGESGNLGIAGHRDGFFRGLRNVRTGDVVELDYPGATSRYVVSQIDIVMPEDTQVLSATRTPSVTLVTCFPFYFVGSAPKRFVVRAILEDPRSDISTRTVINAIQTLGDKK
jgi:sortase A